MKKVEAIKYDGVIKTEYNGQLYRSRLEARWAVFFDSLGIKHEYEPEGYDLGIINRDSKLKKKEAEYWGIDQERLDSLGYYLPDFWLPWQQEFIEIKPAIYDEFNNVTSHFQWPDDTAMLKIYALEIITGHRVVITCGPPGRVKITYGDDLSYFGFTAGDFSYFWCECPECGSIGIQWEGRSARNKHFEGCEAEKERRRTGKDRAINHDSPRLQRAYRAAKRAFIK